MALQSQAVHRRVASLPSMRSMVWNLAWPAITEMFLQTFVQIVSMVLVGHLGAAAVTSIGLSMQPLNAVYGVFVGAGVGATAVVARMIGAGNPREAGRASAQAMVASVLLAGIGAVLMFAKARAMVVWMGAEPAVVEEGTRYLLVMIPGLFFMWIQTVLTGALRGAGDMRTPMKINILINLISFVGNILLVFGLWRFPALGVFGAGLATTTARVIGGILLLIPYLSGSSILEVRFPQDLLPDRALIARVARVGIPCACERLIVTGKGIFYARMIAGLGSMPYAAHTIGANAESISYLTANGFATASTTLTGQNLGAGQPGIAERSTWEAVRQGCLFVGTMGIAFIFFPEAFMRIYTKDQDVVRLGAIYLRIMGFCQVHQLVANVLTGALRGAGDTKFVMYVSAFGGWVLRLGVTYLLLYVVHTGVVGAWWGMTADTLFMAVSSFIWFRTGRWKQVTV